MKLIDPDRNLYLTSESELTKLKYSRINTTNPKDSPKPGDYLFIEEKDKDQIWALVGDGKYIRKYFFNNNITNTIIYRKL